MFNIKYRVSEYLPKLAWLCDIDIDSSDVEIMCGGEVECFDEFFVSGVWDGEFSEGGFDTCTSFYGTGAKFSDDKVIFYTPTHALERIISHKNGDHILFSNSIPFLMSCCSLDLIPSEDQYEKHFCSILYGPDKCETDIKLKDGKIISQYIVGSVTVSSDGSVSYTKRKQIEPFTDFEDYYSRMMEAMKKIKENAVSPDRRNQKFGVCSTITSGYDSTANAAVAKQLGGDVAASLSGGIFDEDDGTKVATEMGYTQIVRRDHLSYRDKDTLVDAEYIASGEIAKHEQFSVFEDIFAGNLVFLGTRGDYFWGLKSKVNNTFETVGFFFNETDSSYIENALKNGYVVVPAATYGASAATSIQRISNSDEMRPWRLFTDYDRPIPRRIAESCGAQRESFGQLKRGGGFSFCYDTMKTLSRKMSRKGYGSFTAFCKENPPIFTFKKLINGIRFHFAYLPSYINYAFKKIGLKIKLKQKPLKVVNPSVSSRLIFWSIGAMKEKYSEMIRKSNLK